MRIPQLTILTLGALGLSGCAPGGFAGAVLSSHFLDLLFAVVIYVIGGGLAGLVIGTGLFLGVRRCGGYAWDWRHARWVRLLTGILVALAAATSGAAYGACLGVVSGTKSFLKEGKQIHEALTKAGEPLADLCCYLIVVSERESARSAAATPAEEEPASLDARLAVPEGELERFRAGEPIALARLGDLSEGLPNLFGAAEATRHIETVLGTLPEEGEEPGVTHYAIATGSEFVVDYMLKRKAQEKVGKQSVEIASRCLNLKEAAKRSDPQSELTRSELAEHFADELYVPLLVVLLKKSLAGHRILCLAVLFLCPLAPLPLYWLARYLQRRWSPEVKEAVPTFAHGSPAHGAALPSFGGEEAASQPPESGSADAAPAPGE